MVVLKLPLYNTFLINQALTAHNINNEKLSKKASSGKKVLAKKT